ncbi:MAG: DUF177 domain-containing protein [Candidatus Eremiobacteraeota bacterium]|nr:DUF177 domain-containing protein [Candidatus Eremiobacteraeota bacterium]MBV8366637.1 DUF177 domain-containing protein [Candidatus Eremiobacteraeota bacterium]
MKISVERLFGPDVEVIDVDQSLRLRDELAARYPDGVRVTAGIRRIQRGVYVEGEITGSEVETCVRCLEPFVRSTRVEIAEPFSEDVSAKDAQFADVAPLVDRTIDLSELVEQLLEVDEPIAAVCGDECRGICPHCGVNRNTQRCECRDEQIDERLAGLAKFIQEPGAN